MANSVGRGVGTVMAFAGAALIVVSAGVLLIKPIRSPERNQGGGKGEPMAGEDGVVKLCANCGCRMMKHYGRILPTP